MKYVVNYIKIKSNWFDKFGRNRMNTYTKIGGYEGLFLYFQLYKFKVVNQDHEDMFITSISLLRKETGYPTELIFDLLKKMKASKVIKMLNVSRWDYLLDENKSIKDKDILMIAADDLPKTERKEKTNGKGEVLLDDNKNPIEIDSPVTEDDYYISINLPMFNLYKTKEMYGTNKGKNIDKYIAFYCLVMKWSNGLGLRSESKMNMKIENIAFVLGIDKDYIHKMIYSLNRYYFMYSTRRKRKAGFGYFFEHQICGKVNDYEKFAKDNKENCDRLVARYDKNKNRNADIENDIETIGDHEEKKEVKKKSDVKAFDMKEKKKNNSSKKDVDWGKPEPNKPPTAEELFG